MQAVFNHNAWVADRIASISIHFLAIVILQKIQVIFAIRVQAKMHLICTYIITNKLMFYHPKPGALLQVKPVIYCYSMYCNDVT